MADGYELGQSGSIIYRLRRRHGKPASVTLLETTITVEDEAMRVDKGKLERATWSLRVIKWPPRNACIPGPAMRVTERWYATSQDLSDDEAQQWALRVVGRDGLS